MVTKDSQSPEDPSSECSIENLLKLISRAVHRAYLTYGHLPNQDDMEDLVQSIVLSLIRNDARGLHSFEHRASEKTWLQTIVNHEVLRFFRGQKATVNVEELPPGDVAYQPGLDEQVLYVEIKKAFNGIAGDLTEREQELLALLGQQLSTKEIANRMGIKPDSVTRNKHRLNHKIRKLLKSKGAI